MKGLVIDHNYNRRLELQKNKGKLRIYESGRVAFHCWEKTDLEKFLRKKGYDQEAINKWKEELGRVFRDPRAPFHNPSGLVDVHYSSEKDLDDYIAENDFELQIRKPSEKNIDLVKLILKAAGSTLKKLHFEDSGYDAAPGDALIDAVTKYTHSLEDLSFKEVDGVSDDGAVRLANSPAVQNLGVLNIYHTIMGYKGLAALLQSPHLGKLRQLHVRQSLIGEYHSKEEDRIKVEECLDRKSLPNLTHFFVSYHHNSILAPFPEMRYGPTDALNKRAKKNGLIVPR